MDNKFRLKLGDWVICIAVLLLAGAIALPFLFAPSGALTCEIKQGDTVIRTIRLAEGYRDTITLTNGKWTNVIEVDGKNVWFSKSNCPDQICVHAGHLTRAGQMAVCLPTRVVVRMVGTGAQVDAVAV
nr:NusG domain II-containing protein [uncultured Butyricicoccus sp.]